MRVETKTWKLEVDLVGLMVAVAVMVVAIVFITNRRTPPSAVPPATESPHAAAGESGPSYR